MFLEPPVRQQIVQRVFRRSPSQLFKTNMQVGPRHHLPQVAASHKRHQHYRGAEAVSEG
jgi:hypothetical protein